MFKILICGYEESKACRRRPKPLTVLYARPPGFDPGDQGMSLECTARAAWKRLVKQDARVA